MRLWLQGKFEERRIGVNMEVLLWSIGEYICTERDKGLGVGFLKLERAVGIFCSCAGEREFFLHGGHLWLNSVSLSVGISF